MFTWLNRYVGRIIHYCGLLCNKYFQVHKHFSRHEFWIKSNFLISEADDGGVLPVFRLFQLLELADSSARGAAFALMARERAGWHAK